MEKKKKKSKIAGNILIILGILLLFGAGGISLYNYHDSKNAEMESQGAVNELKELIDEAVRDENEDTLTIPEVYAENEGIVPEMPTEIIRGYEYIGILEIPSMHISLPVMKDWDYSRLKKAPCRFSGSYYSNDLVIAGHNYRSHFGPVKWIDPETDVYFVNVEGTVYHYAVDSVEVLQPVQVEDMVTGDWDLTLFTCTTGGQTRAAIRCTRVEEE